MLILCLLFVQYAAKKMNGVDVRQNSVYLKILHYFSRLPFACIRSYPPLIKNFPRMDLLMNSY